MENSLSVMEVNEYNRIRAHISLYINYELVENKNEILYCMQDECRAHFINIFDCSANCIAI